MIHEETLRQLNEMKLFGMARAFAEYLTAKQTKDELSFADRFGIFVDKEWTERKERAMSRRLKDSKLREQACLEDVDYRHPRNLDRSVMQRLAACKWIEQHQHIIFTGATGLGKTWLACALANAACRKGYAALYTRVPRLLQDIYIARGDGSYPRLMDRLGKPDVLVLDDFGVTPLGASERRDLFEVIEDRQGRKSTIVVAQPEIKHWHEIIGEPTVADSILDRLTSNAHTFNLKGKSMRPNKTEK